MKTILINKLPDSAHIQISKEERGLFAKLSIRKLHRYLMAIGFDWLVIALCFASVIIWPHPLVWCFAIIIVATRQHALLIIMHDSAHGKLTKHTWLQDRIIYYFCSWPVIVDFKAYRKIHFLHHRHLYTKDDPDMAAIDKRDLDRFPKSKNKVLKWMLHNFLFGFYETLLMRKTISPFKTKEKISLKIEKIIFYIILASIITYFGLWLQVILLWFVPALFLTGFIVRVRTILEHGAVEKTTEVTLSRNNFFSWWSKFLLTPHNSNYHLDHHIAPTVAFYNLPKLHKLLMKNSFYRKYYSSNSQSHSLKSTFGELSKGD